MNEPVLIVMGVAGAGKSTLAKALAAKLGWTFLEGDDLHPPANVAKMRAGHALNDADRWPWLTAIGEWIDARAGEPAVIACSALKRSYREVLSRGRPFVHTVYLEGSRELVGERVAARRNHYFPASLIVSQFKALEPPGPDEHAIVVAMALPVDAQVRQVVEALRS